MANQTVYPYGTGGELPSSIGLVNDFKTGGVNKAWTAEMGKVTGGQLLLTDTFNYDNMTPFSTGKEYKADSSQVGKALSAVTTYNETGFKNFRIPVAGAIQVTYRAFLSSYSYGCLFLNENDIVVEGVVTSSAEDDGMRTIGVPNSAVTFIWSVKESYFDDASMKIVTVDSWRFDEQGKEIENINDEIDVLTNDIGRLVIPKSSFYLYEHYKDGYQLKADSTQVGKELGDVTTHSSSGFVNVKIPIDGCSQAIFMQYTTGASYMYGSLIVDSSDIVLMGIYSVGADTEEVVHLPEDAAYLIYSINSPYSYYDNVTLYREGGIVQRLEELEEKDSSSAIAPSSGVRLNLSSGRVDNMGVLISDNKYVITETIYGKFHIVLNDNWRIYEGHLYARSGKLASYQYLNPNVSWMGSGTWPDTWTNRTFYSNTNVLPDWGMRLVLCKANQGEITEDEFPVRSYINLDDAGLSRWIPDGLSNYDRALRRLDYLSALRWVPLAKVPNGYNTNNIDTGNAYFDLAGQLAVGVPYSDVAETRKYVPNYVSLRTFMTAVKNRRSLLYTEELNNNTSKYGMSYKTGHRRAYYGSVCCGFVNWVMGNDVMYLSDAFGDDTVPGLTTITNADANTVHPLDVVWFSGHVAIVSGVYVDEFGNRRYIEMSEMSTPYPYKILYTLGEFNYRITSAEIHRWNGWSDIQEPTEARGLSQYILGDVKQETPFNPDIMCFAGDYAAFAEGDTIYLNARRNSTYTGIELYKNDVLLQTIDISEMDADTIVTPNTDDWVAVNLTTLNLTYGKYKARMTDGTDTTDYTYFEVIDITLSAVKDGSNIVLTIGSNEGVPVGLEKVKENGFPNGANGYHEITSSEVEAGTITLGSGWGYNSTYKYIMMLVKGDYGTVCNKIVIPSA